MAAEYISTNYPERTGFSPRNLRRMRDFFQMYKGCPDILKQAMRVGWTQNVVIMEADLEMDVRLWYLLAVQKFGWSKAELARQILSAAHLESDLGNNVELCYTETEKNIVEIPENDKDCFRQQEGRSAKPDSTVGHGKANANGKPGNRVAKRSGFYWRGRSRSVTASPKQRLRPLRFAHWNGSTDSLENVSRLRWGFWGQNVPVLGLCSTPWRTTSKGLWLDRGRNSKGLSGNFELVEKEKGICYNGFQVNIASAYG